MGVTPVSALERCRNVMEGDVVRPEGFFLETMRPQYDFMYWVSSVYKQSKFISLYEIVV